MINKKYKIKPKLAQLPMMTSLLDTCAGYVDCLYRFGYYG